MNNKPRFKDPTIERVYLECIRAFNDNDSFLYFNGDQRRGSSGRCNFWNAYNEQGRSPQRNTFDYGYYAAGAYCRKHTQSGDNT